MLFDLIWVLYFDHVGKSINKTIKDQNNDKTKNRIQNIRIKSLKEDGNKRILNPCFTCSKKERGGPTPFNSTTFYCYFYNVLNSPKCLNTLNKYTIKNKDHTFTLSMMYLKPLSLCDIYLSTYVCKIVSLFLFSNRIIPKLIIRFFSTLIFFYSLTPLIVPQKLFSVVRTRLVLRFHFSLRL